ncbi:uncharacterized protein NDAI_0C01930 [Naumovozyma dairenensis CBS 421]|uniref:Uncharacterized protein n=1 Tax=Naumovozyma dairenensis (strain ATCC 10597 / BCRC 20456 / CBS 421 / NBRC 0211 / NRRL Y-12639) TaxID=1071378 RepID=G0W7U2_NAUDC|nr:hypothetical protein NDAI_0C01930 [Naumovozyma dairenensis CBS 421]CCD23853.1 hypothetical protein NDAI_0C01930 [Naumovozyma dairenensis CBS 421]
MSHLPIYTHRAPASTSTSTKIKRLSATDISIREEAEPCELHDRLFCAICQAANEEKMNQVLKRSISYNAVNNVKKRTSITNLHRTLSQTSCYSIGSLQSKQDLTSEPFNEFLDYLVNDNYVSKANLVWENLPKETRDIFVAKAMAKNKHKDQARQIHPDIIELLQSQKQNPHRKVHTSTWRNRKSDYMQLFSDHPKDIPNRRAQNITEILNQFCAYDLTDSEREYIIHKLKARQQKPPEEEEGKRCTNTVEENIFLAHHQFKDKTKDTSVADPYLKEITEKINQLNSIMQRLEKFSPATTPITADADLSLGSTPTSPMFSSGPSTTATTSDHIPIPSSLTSPLQAQASTKVTQKSKLLSHPTRSLGTRTETSSKHHNNTEKKENFFDMLALKSKRFMGRFKHKKPTKLDLYRKPNPDIRVFVNPSANKKQNS